MIHVLIVGFGSIGRRHFRHFRDLGCSPVEVYRTGKATMPADESLQPDRVWHELDRALAAKPDLVVVANPTSLHRETSLKALRAGCHVLAEKPLGDTLDGLDELTREAKKRDRVLAVAHNQRYHPAIRTLHEMIQSGEPLGAPLFARAHIGGYLPDWHPWEDYRQGYAARRDLGGGSSLTNIHEIDYLLWLMGPVRDHAGVELGQHPLGTDVDEASAFLLKHESGAISTATLSLAQKPQSRTLEIAFAKGVARIDNFMTGKLIVEHADGGRAIIDPPDGWELDHTYRDQASDVLGALEGKPFSFTTPEQAISALRIALERGSA